MEAVERRQLRNSTKSLLRTAHETIDAAHAAKAKSLSPGPQEGGGDVARELDTQIPSGRAYSFLTVGNGVGDSISYTEAMDRRDTAVSSATIIQTMLSNGINNMCTMGGISNNSDDAIEGPRKKKLRTSRKEATTGPKYFNSARAPQICEAQQPRTKKSLTATREVNPQSDNAKKNCRQQKKIVKSWSPASRNFL